MCDPTPNYCAFLDSIDLDFPFAGVMRVIVTAQKALLPHYEVILSNLIMILTEISKNPSNPKFNHYTFESISALIR
jgi:hypothetical protein